MLNDILPFKHIAARNDYLKIIDQLADGKLPQSAIMPATFPLWPYDSLRDRALCVGRA